MSKWIPPGRRAEIIRWTKGIQGTQRQRQKRKEDYRAEKNGIWKSEDVSDINFLLAQAKNYEETIELVVHKNIHFNVNNSLHHNDKQVC
jgi:hypothetical protein